MKKLLLALLIILTSCRDEDEGRSLTTIRYGTSFGECLGYCIKELTLTGDQVSYDFRGWDIDGNDLRKTCSQKVDISMHIAIEEGVFFSLPEVIGCPDCADGGAEWIELEYSDGARHKVTFEYRKEPPELADNIVTLRDLMTEAGDCF